MAPTIFISDEFLADFETEVASLTTPGLQTLSRLMIARDIATFMKNRKTLLGLLYNRDETIQTCKDAGTDVPERFANIRHFVLRDIVDALDALDAMSKSDKKFILGHIAVNFANAQRKPQVRQGKAKVAVSEEVLAARALEDETEKAKRALEDQEHKKMSKKRKTDKKTLDSQRKAQDMAAIAAAVPRIDNESSPVPVPGILGALLVASASDQAAAVNDQPAAVGDGDQPAAVGDGDQPAAVGDQPAAEAVGDQPAAEAAVGQAADETGPREGTPDSPGRVVYEFPREAPPRSSGGSDIGSDGSDVSDRSD